LSAQAISIGKRADELRQSEKSKADSLLINSGFELKSGIGISGEDSQKRRIHLQAIDDIKAESLSTVREAVNKPSTPKGGAMTMSFISGTVDNVIDTGKNIIQLGKTGVKAIESLVTWQDKLHLKEKYNNAKDAINAFCQEIKYEWENPEEYKERQQQALEIKKDKESFERAFDAERFHLDRAKEAGYYSAEVLPFVVGGGVLKEGSKLNITNKLQKIEGLGEWKCSTWNIGEAAIHKKHHNWHKIFGETKPTLKDIEPFVKEALEKGEWKYTGDKIRGNGGIIEGDKMKLIYKIEDNEIWVLGTLKLDGQLLINNAGVK